MKRLAILATLALALSIGGCASLVQDGVKYLYGDSQYTQDAVKAAAIGMRTYEGVLVQIDKYGDWPKKGTDACAALKTTLLCRDQAVWDRLKAAVAIASPAVHKARQVIDGVAPDETGTALAAAADAIRETETVFLTNAIPTPGSKP